MRGPPAADGQRLIPINSNLADIVAAWPTLPEPIRAGILAMVRAARLADADGR